MLKIQKVAVVSRRVRKRELSEKVVNLLSEKYNLDVYLNESFARILGYNNCITLDKLKDFDLIVSLGGDGTILWAARHSEEVPIFGINTGALGFLTTVNPSEFESALERIMRNDFLLERCMRLKVTINGEELPTALNEAFITNKRPGHIIALNLAVDNNDLGCDSFDGIIIATPVGSTAYALSAGGAISDPKIEAMHIVPVNSVTRRSRPLVVPGDSKVRLTVPKFFEGEIVVTVDGVAEAEFSPNAVLECTKAERETIFIRFSDYSFYNRLKDKLGI